MGDGVGLAPALAQLTVTTRDALGRRAELLDTDHVAGTAQAQALRLPKGCVVEAKVVAQEAVVDAEQGFVLIEIARRAATGREQNHAGRQECSRIMSKQVLALPAQ